MQAQTFVMLASPGERHEDVIPYGLYTVEGVVEALRELRQEDDIGEYYLFFMKVNQKWRNCKDCDMTVSWGEETPENIVAVSDDTEVEFGELAEYLKLFVLN